MINELIEQIGERERLEAFVYAMGAEPCDADPILDSVTHGDIGKMARALLAVLDAQAIGWVDSEEMRGIDKNRYATIYKIEPDNPYHDPRRQRLVYLSPPAASLPEGYKLVPIEPSKEMLLASKRYKAKNKVPTGPGVYRAMIAAATAPGGDAE